MDARLENVFGIQTTRGNTPEHFYGLVDSLAAVSKQQAVSLHYDSSVSGDAGIAKLIGF